MNRERLLGLLAGAALIAGGCGRGAAPQSAQPSGPVEVGVMTVRAERVVLTTELPGRTAAYLIAEVRPQVNGLIQERRFVEGSVVQKGALLYQIDPAPYQAAFEQAKARTRRGGGNAAAGAAARRTAEGTGGDPGRRAAGLRRGRPPRCCGPRPGVASAARAAVESARINLAYTPLKAPITGRTGKSTVTPGALVTAYQPTPLVTIQQLDPIYVDVTQSSADLLRLRRNLQSGPARARRRGRRAR